MHDVAGLRGVDASSMPTVVSGNANRPVVVIAKKAAAMIFAAAFNDEWMARHLSCHRDCTTMGYVAAACTTLNPHKEPRHERTESAPPPCIARRAGAGVSRDRSRG